MATSICLPCIGLGCDNADDLAAGIDSALYSQLDYSFIVDCPPKCFCPKGLFPQTISILASTIPPVIPSIAEPGDAILLRLQGCTSVITRTLPFGSTQAAIAAAAQSMQAEWAGQQALCLARLEPGVNCNTGTSISVCNDAQNFPCYDGTQQTVPAGTFCENLNTTGLTASQIAAAVAALKAKLNQIAKDSVCPFSGIFCPFSSTITFPDNNGFGLAVTNDSGTQSFDCTPITTHHVYNGNLVLDQTGVGSIAPGAIAAPVGGIGGIHGPGSNLLEIRYFGHLIFSFSSNWLGTLHVLMTVYCA